MILMEFLDYKGAAAFFGCGSEGKSVLLLDARLISEDIIKPWRMPEQLERPGLGREQGGWDTEIDDTHTHTGTLTH